MAIVDKIEIKTYSKIFLRNLNPNWERFQEYIDCINKIRTCYKYSSHTYNANNIKNVYLIEVEKCACGFVECEYKYLDIEDSTPIRIFIDDLHIAEAAQRLGVGEKVFDHLLSKNCSLEMVVVSENIKINGLLNKYEHERTPWDGKTETILLKRKI